MNDTLLFVIYNFKHDKFLITKEIGTGRQSLYKFEWSEYPLWYFSHAYFLYLKKKEIEFENIVNDENIGIVRVEVADSCVITDVYWDELFLLTKTSEDINDYRVIK